MVDFFCTFPAADALLSHTVKCLGNCSSYWSCWESHLLWCVHRRPVQCSAVQSSAVQCSAVPGSASLQCSAVQCSAVQVSAVQYVLMPIDCDLNYIDRLYRPWRFRLRYSQYSTYSTQPQYNVDLKKYKTKTIQIKRPHPKESKIAGGHNWVNCVEHFTTIVAQMLQFLCLEKVKK